MVKKNEKFKKAGIVLSIVLLGLAIVFLIGKSFSFFSYRKEGQTVNVITFKGLDVRILNSQNNSLNLANSYPMYDSQGLAGTPFEFEIENKMSNSIAYTLKIENDEDKQNACTVNSQSCPALSASYIRYAYKIDNGSYSTPANLANNSNSIYTNTIQSGATVKVSILLWIDQTAPNSIQGKYFFGKVVLEAAKQQ